MIFRFDSLITYELNILGVDCNGDNGTHTVLHLGKRQISTPRDNSRLPGHNGIESSLSNTATLLC